MLTKHEAKINNKKNIEEIFEWKTHGRIKVKKINKKNTRKQKCGKEKEKEKWLEI